MINLPEGWERTKLGEIFEIVGGSTPKTSTDEFWGGDIPWITPDDLSRHSAKHIRSGRRSLTEAGFRSASCRMLPAGSVLYSSRAPIGYTVIAAEPVSTNQGFKSLVVPDGISSDYVYWYMQHATPMVRDRASGTTFKEISGKGMKEVPIPVPPLPEQRRIVAAIEEHFSRLDAAEASVSSASDRSKMSLQAGLRGLLDSSGNRHRLAEVCSHIVDCEHSTAKFVPTGVPCVDTTNVEPFRLAPDRFRFVSETTYIERIRRIEPTEGDVIFTREGTIGSAAMVPPGLRLCLGQRVAILRPSTSLDSQYLELALNSLLVRQQYRPLIQGTTAPHLNMRDIRALSIPVPSIQDQKAIVVVAQQLLSAHTLADMAIGQAKRRSAALRRSILAAAFSGRLVPQDPSDEPASALLERIAAERETSKPTRKKKAAS